MKFRIPAVTAVLLCSSLIASHTSVHAITVPAAAKQTLRVIEISEHCVDEFDEEESIFINEGDAVCKITVQVRGRGKTKSKVLLQYMDDDEGWISAGYKVLTTNASGKVTFSLVTDFPNEFGDDCYDNDSYTHRFAVVRSGRYKAFKSATFDISYTSSDTNPACSYDE
jgi:hypothetical protein